MNLRILRLLLPLLLLLAPLAAEDNLKFGRPACAGPVLDKKFFVICYDEARKVPAWVGYALTKDDAETEVTKRQGTFQADPTLPAGKRAENADYSRSGYDKGHMAPANDFKRSVEAMHSTFVLSNAVPQKHGVNGGDWAKLEAAVHAMAAGRGTVWVFSGPVFVNGKPLRTIGHDKVAVPTHTYKVVLCVRPDGTKEMYAFVMPNLDKPQGTISTYTFSVDEVEKLTGLDFFAALPPAEQETLEKKVTDLP